MGNGNYSLLLDECSHFKYYKERSLHDIHVFYKLYREMYVPSTLLGRNRAT